MKLSKATLVIFTSIFCVSFSLSTHAEDLVELVELEVYGPPAPVVRPLGWQKPAEPKTDEEVATLDHQLQQMKSEKEALVSALDSLNQRNPFSGRYVFGKSLADFEVPPEFSDLKALLVHPGSRSALALFSQGQFRSGTQKMIESGRGALFWYVQGALLALFFLFRWWRLSHTQNWIKKSAIKLWSGLGYTVLALVVVPVIVFGEGYIETLQGLMAAVSA